MSQPIAIVRKTEQGYNEFGIASHQRDAYIKLSTSLRQGGLFKLLRGARLHIFIMIALHEADDQPGASLHTLQAETGISAPTIIDSLKFLTDPQHPFVRHVGYERDGTKRYRPCSLAWHGKDSQFEGSGKETLYPKKISSHDHDDDRTKSVPNENNHHHDHAAAQKILFDAGFRGKRLDELAERLSTDEATRVAEWVALALQATDLFHEPFGYAYVVVTRGSVDDLPTILPPEPVRRMTRADFTDAQFARLDPRNQKRLLEEGYL